MTNSIDLNNATSTVFLHKEIILLITHYKPAFTGNKGGYVIFQLPVPLELTLRFSI
jgi:hypothetical protein